jgi:hypothetical protein
MTTMLTNEYKKSTFSSGGDNCLFAKRLGENVSVHNSRTGVTDEYTNDEWAAFIAGAKDGQFDLA